MITHRAFCFLIHYQEKNSPEIPKVVLHLLSKTHFLFVIYANDTATNHAITDEDTVPNENIISNNIYKSS